MGAIFGKRKAPSKVTEQDKAVLQLKHQRDQLKQYQKKIENKLTSDRQLASKLLKEGKKDRAKLLLRKKRYQEQLLQNTDNQLEQLERLTHDIEFAQVESRVLDGLREGNEALKRVNEVLNIDEIERILDETREGVEKQQEIDALISGALTPDDELAVEAEFEDLIKDSLPDIPSIDIEPSVTELPEEITEERKVKERKPQKVALEAS